jgi:hypothetical protein
MARVLLKHSRRAKGLPISVRILLVQHLKPLSVAALEVIHDVSGSWIKGRDGGLVHILLGKTGRLERKRLWDLLFSS